MAPRSGTAGTGQSSADADEHLPIYGTRSSKRKAEPEDEQPNSQESRKTSSVTSKRQKTSEPSSPPAPKKRIGAPRSQSVMKSEVKKSPSPDEAFSSQASSPDIPLDMPSGTSEEPESQDHAPTMRGWVEPSVMETVFPPDFETPPASPKKGGFRGRGGGLRGRGRGGRGGGRGGRPPKNASGRATPVPSNGVVKPAGRGRGGGRGRARKQTSAEMKAITRRRDELKAQYKLIATAQRDALDEIAERSLVKILEDRKYHETLPEFEILSTRLDELRDARLSELDVRARFESESAYRVWAGEKDRIESIFQNDLENIYDKYMTRMLDQSSYVIEQANNYKPLDEIPFSGGEHNRRVEYERVPAKIVHPFATSRFKDPVIAVDYDHARGNPLFKQDPKAYLTEGDNEFEQHPANHYFSLTKEGKRAHEKEKKQAIDLMKKEKGKKHVTNKDSLFGKKAKDLAEESEVENDQAHEQSQKKEVLDKTSRDDSENPFDSAPEQAEDEYGCSVPNKKGRGKAAYPNNRIVLPPYVQFEEDLVDENNGDIGIRKHTFKTLNGEVVPAARDANPNPEKFYVNQVVSQHNSAKNVLGDLDEHLVKQYKVHPVFGVGIMGSVNPDEDDPEHPTFAPKTSYNGKHPNNRSTTIIHDHRDGSRTIEYTSKSQALQQAEKDNDHFFSQVRLRKMLEDIGEFEALVHFPEQVVNTELVDAATEAAKEAARIRQAEILAAAQAPPPIIRSMPAYTPPQRSRQYDPVRDSTTSVPYQTPYAQPGQQSSRVYSMPAPIIHHPPGHLGALAAAAEMAHSSNMRPLLPADLRPQNPPHHSPQNPFTGHSSNIHHPGPPSQPMRSPGTSYIQLSPQGYGAHNSLIAYAPAQFPQQYPAPSFTFYGQAPPPPPPPQYMQQAQQYTNPPPPQQPPQSPKFTQHLVPGGLRELRPAAIKSRAPQNPRVKQAPPPPPPPPSSWSPYGAPPPPPGPR